MGRKFILTGAARKNRLCEAPRQPPCPLRSGKFARAPLFPTPSSNPPASAGRALPAALSHVHPRPAPDRQIQPCPIAGLSEAAGCQRRPGGRRGGMQRFVNLFLCPYGNVLYAFFQKSQQKIMEKFCYSAGIFLFPCRSGQHLPGKAAGLALASPAGIQKLSFCSRHHASGCTSDAGFCSAFT